MNQDYSYLDVAALDGVRQRFSAGDALVILSADLDDIIWANGPGAKLLGFSDIDAAIGATTPLSHIARRQIIATPHFPSLPAERPIIIRLSAMLPAVRVHMRSLVLPDGEEAILLAAEAERSEDQPNLYDELALAGFDEKEQRVALLGAGGTVLVSLAGFDQLEFSTEMLADFCLAAQKRGRVATRLLSSRHGRFPAGIARLSDDPDVYFLIAIVEDEDAVVAAPEIASANVAPEKPVTPDLPVVEFKQPSLADKTPEVILPPEEEIAPPAPVDIPVEITAHEEELSGELEPEVPSAPEMSAEVPPPLDEIAEAPAEAIEPVRAPEKIVEESATPILSGPATVRFVWRTDETGHFSSVSPEFADAVGPTVADIVGIAFREIAARYGFDKDGEIADLLERRDTWSGRSVLWPLEGSSLRVPVDLAALPVYDRDRNFEGFRGFGTIRMHEAVSGPDLQLVDDSFLDYEIDQDDDLDEFIDAEFEQSDWEIDEFPPSPDLLADNENLNALSDLGEIPELPDLPDELDNQHKVIQFDNHRPASVERSEKERFGLSAGEKTAFREIGERLKSASTKVEKPATEPSVAVPSEPKSEEAAPKIEAPVEVTPVEATPVEPTPVATSPVETGVEVPAPVAVPDPVAPVKQAPPETVPEPTEAQTEPLEIHQADAPVPAPTEAPTHIDFDAQLAIEGVPSNRQSKRTYPSPIEALREDTKPVSLESSAQNAAEAEQRAPERLIFSEDQPQEAKPAPSSDTDSVSEVLPTTKESVSAPDASQPAARDIEAPASSSPHNAADDAAPSAARPDMVQLVEILAPLKPAAKVQAPVTPQAAEFQAPPSRPDDRAQDHYETQFLEPRDPQFDSALFDALPIAVLIHAGERLDFANREFFAFTGYSSLQALRDAGGLDALFVPEGGEEAEISPPHLVMRRADGLDIHVRAHLQSVSWGSGKSLMMTLRAVDNGLPVPQIEAQSLLDSKDAEAEIARVHGLLEEMRAIVDTATDGVILITRDGRIRMLSRPAEALFGVEAASVEGQPFHTLFAIESHRPIKDYLTGLTDNGVASVLNDGREVIGREAEGRFIPLFMTIGRLPSESGFCAVVRDITQWKRAEEELTQARAQAERSSSQKTEFLARVSHEIRTPLNAIIGFSELMISEAFGPIGNQRYGDYIRDINRSGSHVLDLVNDLLDISKIEAGEQELAYVAVALNDTIGEAVATMQPQANRDRVIIRSSFASRLPDVVADLRSVRQIALNLLSNAVRYTQAGGQVIVSTSYEHNGEVVLRIRDTGVGMSSAEIDQALRPFKQINALKRARGDGTGLGLPLTKALVEANRARFTIQSTPRQGTLVEVTFPSTRVLAD